MRSDLSEHQHVTLYPSYVFFDRATNEWHLPLSAFVHSKGKDGVGQKVFRRLLQQVLDVEEQQLQTNEWFAQRIPYFLQDPQRGAEIAVAIDPVQQPEPGPLTVASRSGRDGHVKVAVPLPPSHVSPDWESQFSHQITPLRYSVVMPNEQRCPVTATARIIPPQGVSVISDIDDTIKISQVAHRRQLLHNTFLHSFVAVPGMAQLFRQWQNQGVAFHYVSSSPWQLFSPLQEFMQASRFPVGSFHLRTYQFNDPSILKLFLSRKRNKFKIIESIFNQFPERHFVLIGDSGEKDAEIYGKVARRYPRQTRRILIREVEGKPWTKKRIAKAFRDVPEDCWQIFQVPTQIRDLALKTKTV